MHLKTLSFCLAVALASTVTLAAPVDYKIDPTHTATVFSWNHFGFSTPSANFSDSQGVIKVDNAKPANASVNVTIPLSSVNTNVPALDKEFQEEAWFNAAKYPNITFTSTKVETKDKKHFKITVRNQLLKNMEMLTIDLMQIKPTDTIAYQTLLAWVAMQQLKQVTQALKQLRRWPITLWLVLIQLLLGRSVAQTLGLTVRSS